MPYRVAQLVATCLAALMLATAPAAGAQAPAGSDDCGAFPPAPDGTLRQSFDSVDVTGGIAGMPPRQVVDVAPGRHVVTCVGFQNRTGKTIDLGLRVADVGSDDEGRPATQQQSLEFGASSWIELPADAIRALPHGDIAWLQVLVRVPPDAAPGSTYASVVASYRPPPAADRTGVVVQSVPSVAVQLFFDLPGGGSRSGRIMRVRGPRVLWWDGLDAARLPLLERVRGPGAGTFRARWHNTGEYSDEVVGRLVVESDLTGRDVARIPVEAAVVLRGATRTFEASWSRDIPLVGRFTPTFELRGGDGEVVRRELDPVWVIPSWWYLAALALALIVPLWVRRRRLDESWDEQAEYEPE